MRQAIALRVSGSSILSPRPYSLVSLLLALALLLAGPVAAQQKPVKVRNVEGRWQVNDNTTLKEAEERAFLEAKKEALRRAGVMENVWSVFGQITQENGTEFEEAYSQMNVLAIGGMLNVTRKRVDEVWDTESRSLYKVVTIDATVQKGQEADPEYALEVRGLAPLYRQGEVLNCKLKVHGSDSYLKFFWFDDTGGSLLYPNSYEGDQLFEAGREYGIPLSNAVEYRMEKTGKAESEKINMMLVATKENIPYTGEVTYGEVLKWVYSIAADKRCAFYEMVIIK